MEAGSSGGAIPRKRMQPLANVKNGSVFFARFVL